MTELVPVRVPCPDGQHPDGDSVSLRPKLGLAAGIAAQQTIQAIGKGASTPEVTGTLLELYLRHGVAEWTLHNGSGPIELTPETLQTELLDDFARAEPIADKADTLYYAAVVAPLVAAASKSSQATRRAPSTSASTASPAPRRKRSKRSSTSPTQTDGTEPTSS